MKKLLALVLVCMAFVFAKCSDDNNPETPKKVVTKAQVIKNYAKIVYQGYKDSHDAAVALQAKITAFTAKPTEATLKAAKDEWLKARDIYGQTEAFRDSNGPIDADGGESWAINNEGQLNAWPLDEGWIDYVKASSLAYAGDYKGGIIAGKEAITKALLIGKNEGDGEKAISTGWHAIEFLLWGQDETDPKELKAGLRPVTDYTTDAKKDRRIKYLTVVTEILIDDLKALADTWKEGGTYYKVFMALSEDQALKNIMKGPFFLSSSELAEERMLKPVDMNGGINNSGQEDEHSCFSDNTHRDVLMNGQGIVNVLFGKYGAINGPSVYDLIKQKDASSAQKMKEASDAMMAALNKIDADAKNKKPFDVLLQLESVSKPGDIVAGGKALKKLGDNISLGASKLGISVK